MAAAATPPPHGPEVDLEDTGRKEVHAHQARDRRGQYDHLWSDQNMAGRQAKGGCHAFPKIKTWPRAKPKEDATLFPRSKHGHGPSQRRMPRFSQDQNMAARQAKGGRHAFPNIKTWPCAKPKEDATLFPRSKHGRTPSQRRTPSFSREQNMAALQAKGGRHAFPKIKTWPRAKPKEDATL